MTLFPEDGPTYKVMGLHVTVLGQEKFEELQPVTIRPCARCGVPVFPAEQDRHTAWHAAVDTSATTQLPREGAHR